MVRLFAIIFVAVLIFSLVPIQSQAAGLVVCGAESNDPDTPDIDESQDCQLCHLFVLLKNIVDFFLVPTPVNNNIPIVPIIATFFLALGGFLFFVSVASGQALLKGKSIIMGTIIGLLIIYGSWVFLNMFLDIIGVATWTGLDSWWDISC